MEILKNNEGIVHKAEFILTLTWDKKDVNDMDIWLKDPRGDIIYYKDKESSVMFLDRDDLGLKKDKIMINGVEQIIYINQEIISIRAIFPGKWTVAVHFYKRNDKQKPGTIIPVTVRLDKINPSVKIIFNKELNMRQTWEEVTAASFEVLPDGTVVNIQFEMNEPMVHERIPMPIWGPDADGDGDPEGNAQNVYPDDNRHNSNEMTQSERQRMRRHGGI
jgi:hypothetical protein